MLVRVSACETRRLASASALVDRVVDEPRLERVLLVDDHLDRRLLRRVDCELRDRVLGDDQRAEHVAVAHLLLGLLARADDAPGRRARRRSLRGRGRGRSPCPPIENFFSLDGISFTNAIRGFSGPRLKRQPDQQRDDDRVEHQQRDQQRRAPQDPQVLCSSQRTRQCPRSCRKATNAASKSGSRRRAGAGTAPAAPAGRPRTGARRRPARAPGRRSARPPKRRASSRPRWCRRRPACR